MADGDRWRPVATNAFFSPPAAVASTPREATREAMTAMFELALSH